MCEEKKPLVIVCEESWGTVAKLLKGLIETKDDEKDKVIGTKDGSVDVAIWSLKMWKDNKETFTGKVLFLGKVEGETDYLEIMKDLYTNQYNVRIGKCGKVMVIDVNKPWMDSVAYADMLDKLKNTYKMRIEKECTWIPMLKTLAPLPYAKFYESVFIKGLIYLYLGRILTISEVVSEIELMKKQQRAMAVNVLYYDYLEEFMND